MSLNGISYLIPACLDLLRQSLTNGSEHIERAAMERHIESRSLLPRTSRTARRGTVHAETEQSANQITFQSRLDL